MNPLKITSITPTSTNFTLTATVLHTALLPYADDRDKHRFVATLSDSSGQMKLKAFTDENATPGCTAGLPHQLYAALKCGMSVRLHVVSGGVRVNHVLAYYRDAGSDCELIVNDMRAVHVQPHGNSPTRVQESLGMGSGWFELEHDSFGIPFETFTQRFEKLEEALQIILPMLNGERPSLDGKHYQVTEAINSPAPLSKIPLMIGGAGEKKTLRMVAQYADESNLICGVQEIPRKLDVLAEHCERLGRDRSEIKVTRLVMGVLGHTMEDAEASIDAYMALHGWPAEAAAMIRPMMTVGGPDEFGAQIQEMIDAGLDGITMNLATTAHDSDMISLAGEICGAIIP